LQIDGEGGDEVSQLSSRRVKKRSVVWNHFEELPLEGKVMYIHCQARLSNNQGTGISHEPQIPQILIAVQYLQVMPPLHIQVISTDVLYYLYAICEVQPANSDLDS
jgi:hypothetical protein